MIPALDANGVLPPGVHDATLEEIRERFGGIGYGGGRHVLVERLARYLGELIATKLIDHVIVDGSFVTAKPDPGDIDLIIVLSANHDFGRDLRPFEANPLSKRWVAKHYQFDVLVAQEGSSLLAEYLAFFARVRGNMNSSKGVLRVRP